VIGQGRVYYSVAFDSFDESQARHFIAYSTTNTLPPDLVAGNMIIDHKAKRLIGGDNSISLMSLFKVSTFSKAEVTATVGQSIFSALKVEPAEAQIDMMEIILASHRKCWSCSYVTQLQLVWFFSLFSPITTNSNDLKINFSKFDCCLPFAAALDKF
jgi:hypothetical protein